MSTHLSDILDVDRLHYHLNERNVSAAHHPTEPLTIYNYTAACQYRGAWGPTTRLCRGLIVNRDSGEVVASPFPKFHNLSEHGDGAAAGALNLAPPLTVFDKLDGSLGIAYRPGSSDLH